MKKNYDGLLGYNFIEISRKITVQTSKELSVLDITFPQYRVLSRLWLEEELTHKKLGEALSLAPGTLSAIIKLLEKKKLIIRTTKEDGRAKYVKLTDAGMEIRHKAFEIVMKFERERLCIFEGEDGEKLLKMLIKVNETLSK